MSSPRCAIWWLFVGASGRDIEGGFACSGGQFRDLQGEGALPLKLTAVEKVCSPFVRPFAIVGFWGCQGAEVRRAS